MNSRFQQGKLTTWNDDRGFGFVQSEGENRTVFLHISSLKQASRRPRVGDIILYQKVATADGKVRAENASIRSAAVPRYRTSSRKLNSRGLFNVVAGIGGLAMLGFASIEFGRPVLSSLLAFAAQPSCSIKGNISIDSGKKLYHLPGMEDYETTNIEPIHGERWFCTEADAKASGWQKAPR